MRSASIWLVVASLFAGLGCSKNDNNNGLGDQDMADTNGDAGDAGSDTSLPDTGVDMTAGDSVSIPGLTGPATVMFDDKGVLHVSCQTANDCFAVQGYYHAAHRFVQMDIQRRFVTGRLSALIGSLEGVVLDIDKGSRGLLSTREGVPLEQAIWDESSESTKSKITAYTAGVNAWLDDLANERNGARLPLEYENPIVDLEAATMPWTETDTVSAGLLLIEQLSNTGDDDLWRGQQYPKLTPEQAFDLLGTMSATQVSTMGASGESYSRIQALRLAPDAERLRPTMDRLRPTLALFEKAQNVLANRGLVFGGDREHRGSNNWVIGGDRTTSGHPVLSNDPHLGLSNPALWYMVELHATGGADDLHVAGVSIPGAPGVLLGHNEDIAWGATVVYMDLADVYTEELTPDGKSVVFNGGNVPITEVEYTFEVARADDVTETLRFVPHHGYVLSYDAANNAAVSIRWAAQDTRKVFDIFFGLATATNVAEARTALANSKSTNQNWIVADRNGDIGWFPFNGVPSRPWASLAMPPWLPLPGDGSAEWGPTIPVDDQPQMLNPTNGFIVTANTDPTGATFDGDPTNDPFGYVASFGSVVGLRQDAIVKRVLDAGNSFTADISKDMQADTFLVARDWILPHVKTVVDADPTVLSAEAQAYWATLENWDGTCPSGIEGRDPQGPKVADAAIAAASIGCVTFTTLMYTLTDKVFADELRPTRASSRGMVSPLIILLNDSTRLQAGDAYWDDVATTTVVETRDEVILAAIQAATDSAIASFGTDQDEWRNGRHHVLVQTAQLFGLYTQTYNQGPYAAPGGFEAINVANPRSDWTFGAGPSMRHVSEFTADGIKSFWTLPGGQRHFRDSPHYDDLLDDWLATNHFELPFTPEAVSAAAVETVEVSP